ncbi:uncharacterized protein LOC128342428 isoform X3 [Hemicordylus capensis]|nr:uncharacterized protein LOC128342428 isoform X3 [Hemicordylus capensis]
MVSLYFTTKRSFATGILMAGGAAGIFVQNTFHQFLIQKLGWRSSLRLYSGILSICLFAGFAFKPLQKHRAHPSVVEKFQTSPLRGFIVDLSLWKDRIFEVWVCALGLAKFGFFIPFVHMMNLAGDLGIPLEKASYIMMGLGLSSAVSCLLFGKICDIERINRLYLNQVSILSVGVAYFLIPYCTSLYSLIAICSVLGFFDAVNYILLPVLTFDLMGAEKMTVAWGFMMAVNSISCFGAPFAGWMYDIFGNYNIGFIVTGICNIAAASILAFIPWLQIEAGQFKKNYINASICQISGTIIPWQSSASSLGSLTSSCLSSSETPDEETRSQHSKKFSIKSLKSILKSETTSFRSTSSYHEAIIKKEDGKTYLDVEGPVSGQHEHVGSSTDLHLMEDLTKSEAASFKSETSLPEKQQTECMISPPHRKEDGVAFLGIEESDRDLCEQAESATDSKPTEDLTESAVTSFRSDESAQFRTSRPHKKGVAFLDVEGSVSDLDEDVESRTDLRPMEDPDKSGRAYFTSETSGPTKHIPHRKEDGVAFLDIEDDDSDQEEQLENTSTLRPTKDRAKSGKALFKSETFIKHIPHRKEDGVAFLDIEDDDSDEEEQCESTTDLRSIKDQTKLETASMESESSVSITGARKDANVEDDNEQPQQ